MAADQPIRRVDLMGKEQSLPPRDGRIAIPIDQDPIYLIGAANQATKPSGNPAP
jgi:hypothetical protein